MQSSVAGISQNAAAGKSESERWAGGKCLVGCQNVGPTERAVSAILGGALLAGGLQHPASAAGLVKLGLGGSLLYRAATGFCSLYKALGVSTAEATDLGTLQDQQLEQARKHPDPIDEASKESFPASDPPGWTATSATRSM